MPIEETIGTGLKIVLELIKILNPSELERVKKEIRETEEENEERDKKIREAIAGGDVDTLNSLLFGK